MTSEAPELIAIDHDDYHAEHVGHTRDGRQFFLTTPFEPPSGADEGGEFVALFLFDGEGNLVAAEIDDFGPRATVDEAAVQTMHELRLAELGDVTFDRIEVNRSSSRSSAGDSA